MPIPRMTKTKRGQVHATTASTLTGLDGPVVLAYGANTLRISGYGQNFRGSFQIRPRYRKYAVRVDAPEDAAWTEGTVVSTAVPFSEDFSLAALGSFLFLQPAVGASVSAGSGGEGLVAFTASTDSSAIIVARQTIQLAPDINTSTNAIIPLGQPFAALSLSGVMVGVAARGVTGSPQINFLHRTIEGDPSIPSDWAVTALLGTNKTLSLLNEDYNTGNLAFAPSDVGWAQLALRVAAGTFNGTLDIVVAAKY